MKKINSKTIVFIPGAFIHNRCWDDWIIFFQQKGFDPIAVPWPGKDGDSETLRLRHPDYALAQLTLPRLIDFYKDIVTALPERPIIIGQSLGALVAQILMNQGLAAAVVAMHPAPPWGVFPTDMFFFKNYITAIGPFTDPNKTYMISFKIWQHAFTNGMSFEAQKGAYYDLATPESKRVLRGLFSPAAYIDFKKEHAPLLILAGQQDRCFPAQICERIFLRYKNKNSVTELYTRNRNHFILCLDTWKQDAEFIHRWIAGLA